MERVAHRMRRSKTFRRMLKIYGCILFLPIIGYISVVSVKVSNDETANFSAHMAAESERYAAGIDRDMQSVMDAATRALSEKWITKYMANSPVFDGQFSQLVRMEALDSLRDVPLYSPLISFVAIVFPQRGEAVCPWGWYEESELLAQWHLKAGGAGELARRYRGPCSFAAQYDLLARIGETAEESVPIISSLEMSNTPRAGVILFIGKDRLAQMLAGLTGECDAIVEILANGEPLVSSLPSNGDHAPGSTAVLTLPAHAMPDWEYRFTFRRSVLSSFIGGPAFIAASEVAGVMVWMLLSLTVSVISYTPIQRLLRRVLDAESLRAAAGAASEYALLCDVFGELANENRQMKRIVSEITQLRQREALRALLRGGADAPTRDQLAEIGFLYADQDYYSVLLARYISSSGDEERGTSGVNLLSVLNHTLMEFQLSCRIVDPMDNEVAILIHMTPAEMETQSFDVGELIHEVRQVGEGLMIAHGSIERGLGGIASSYRRASEKLRALMRGTSSAEELMKNLGDTAWKNDLRERLSRGEDETALRMMRMALAVNPIQGEGEHARKHEEGSPGHLIEYVHLNVFDADLSLKALSTAFSMPVSTVSRVFKEEAGENYHEYVSRMRIDRAKQLMGSGEESIKNLASMVGYQSDYTFRRAFKRYENMTPAEYIAHTFGKKPRT